ncbi:MAG: HDOD domain-containing protein [Candidatus Krumholzibacteria bacterium]|nr:HDOD domain-containing protein [Candidatus Krumholzibacteria bacterium]
MSATARHQSLMDIHPRELKRFVTDLPTLPVVFQELFSRMQDPDAKISELAEVIARDQALTIKILKLVNSAFYGRSAQISTISRAVIIMGFQAVRSAALAVSVLERFKDLETDGAFSLTEFWRHSIGVSCLAKQAAIVLHVSVPEDAFVAGLLHDVGKLVMLQHFPDDVNDLTRAAAEQRLTWRTCEEMLFPIQHDTIGRALFRAWDFPEAVIEAVACHHTPTASSRYAELTALVHLADFFSYHMDCGCPGSAPARTHCQDAARLVALTPDSANEVLQRARDEFAESLELLKLLD